MKNNVYSNYIQPLIEVEIEKKYLEVEIMFGDEFLLENSTFII